MRICSLLPSATEIVCALGLGDDLVGVTHECDYPPETKRVPVVVRSRIDPHRLNSGAIDRSVRDHAGANRSLYTVDLPQFLRVQSETSQAVCWGDALLSEP